MTRTSLTPLRAALLAVAMAAGSACTPVPVAGGGDFMPIELPIVLRGRAPDYEREATVERVAEGAGLAAVLETYRLDQAATKRFVERPFLNVQWWLVVPPAQPSGGWRLQVTWSDENADACLMPPRGAATTAFEKGAWLVGLPPNVDLLRWRPACPRAGAVP